MNPVPAVEISDTALSLDLRGLKAFITAEDGDLLMVVHDGNQSITFECGAGGSFEDAIRGAEQLADMAMQFAGLLQVRAGSWRPLTRVSEPAPPTDLGITTQAKPQPMNDGWPANTAPAAPNAK